MSAKHNQEKIVQEETSIAVVEMTTVVVAAEKAATTATEEIQKDGSITVFYQKALSLIGLFLWAYSRKVAAISNEIKYPIVFY